MNRSHLLIALCALLPLAAWFAGTPADMSSAGFWIWRKESIYASGLMAYAAFTVCLLLATRARWLERLLGGLDKSYRVHKWLGIGGAALVFAHWMLEIVPKAFVKWGWLARPVRGPKTEQWLGFLNHPAKEVGEWMAYLMIALALVALIRLVPYHWFRRIHKVFPLAFLAATFHGAVLMPDAMWASSAGLVFTLCAGAGCAAAVYSLRGLVGRGRQHTGTVARVRMLDGDMVEVECDVAGHGMPHRPGQFAFVRWGAGRDAHPFTIASGSGDPYWLRFCIKALGDDTRALLHTLRPGMAVALEGPYGGFDFSAGGKAQVWVGAGIGITPFLARLEALAKRPANAPVDFYYCAPADSPFADRLRALCERARVRLHWIDSGRDGLLTLERILANQRRAAHEHHLWFCGPQAFGDALQRAWRQAGLGARRFHREHFAFR
ncbi:MAG: ferric reductase-like transmembrane domain-containing protein [Burkholderiaceae bacterium]|nr:ferric reductase-like transmembrane domain-containing protein [Burkholderiaceae bacterium]